MHRKDKFSREGDLEQEKACLIRKCGYKSTLINHKKRSCAYICDELPPDSACCLSSTHWGWALSWVLLTRWDSSSREARWVWSPAELLRGGGWGDRGACAPADQVWIERADGLRYLLSASPTFHAWIPKLAVFLARSLFPRAQPLRSRGLAPENQTHEVQNQTQEVFASALPPKLLGSGVKAQPKAWNHEPFHSGQFISGDPLLVLASETWSAQTQKAPSGLPEFLSLGVRGQGMLGLWPPVSQGPADS